MKELPHIGKAIKGLMKQKDISVKQLSKKLDRHNTIIYRWLKKRHLDTHTLLLLSQALDENLFQYLCQPGEAPINKALQERTAELETENERLQEKVQMLEEMNALLRKG